MKIAEMESVYEAARMWTLHPVSHPPPGWAQLLRSGIATWMRETHAPMESPSPSPQPTRLSVSPLLTLVAAMIAEVSQC